MAPSPDVGSPRSSKRGSTSSFSKRASSLKKAGHHDRLTGTTTDDPAFVTPVGTGKEKAKIATPQSVVRFLNLDDDGDEDGRQNKRSSTSSRTTQSSVTLSPGKSPEVLRKKISKVNSMIKEAEGEKKVKRLTTKLNQYQYELELAIAQAEREDDAEESGLPPPPPPANSPPWTPSTHVPLPATPQCDYKLLNRKLKKCDRMMEDIVKKEGEKAFQTKEFQKYLRKRQQYLDALEAAGLKEEKPLPKRKPKLVAPPPLETGEALTSKKKKRQSARHSARPSMQPKRKSEAVSAPHLAELEEKYTPPSYKKKKKDEDLIRKELGRNFIFKKLAPSLIEILTKAFEPAPKYKKGEVVIEQGDGGDYFYVIASGTVDYELDGDKVGSDQTGSSFGELALLYTCPRKATVRASSDSLRLYRVDQTTFRYTLQNRSKWITMWQRAVKKVMAMNRLLEIRQSEKAKADHDGSDDDDKSINVQELTEDEEDEFDIDGDLSAYIGNMSSKRLTRQSSIASQNSRVSMASFNRESVLGEGQFGEVWLVNSELEEFEDESFALKIQSKEDMFRASNSNMTGTVADAIERECEVLSLLCHPFIVEFVHKFEDDENIYLVMGVIKGVELWNVIHREESPDEWVSGIEESQAKFYGVLIADTLRFMHQKRICYRDMKPENVMVDHTGYPVIVDFGFAKVIPDGKTFTFCGTVNYTCPEIISNQGHGCPADNWALGVVIYEMISGENPFYYEGISELQLLNDITDADPEPLSNEYSAEVRDLVDKLLIKDPSKRLGSITQDVAKRRSSGRGSNDIIKHPWFNDIDLPKARLKQIPAPWAPKLDDEEQ